MAFKMKGYSGSPAKNYKKGYYGDSPAKKTYKEAYKSRDMKTYGSMSESEYTAEAKRQKTKHAATGKWDTPGSSQKTVKLTTKKPQSVKSEPVINKPTKAVRSEKQVKKDTRKSAKAIKVANRLKNKDAKRQAVASQPGTTNLERKLNLAGKKARERKALRGEKKERKQNLKKQVSSSSETKKNKKEWMKTGKKNITKDIRSKKSKM
jgi:hypothetical protein